MKYTKDHEWISIEGEIGTIGITAFAAEQVGDVVSVDTPEIGAVFSVGDDMAVVDSVKAASDVFAPVSGEIVEVNGALVEAPETVNADPEGAGWFCQIRLSDPTELDALMDADAYARFCAGEG